MIYPRKNKLKYFVLAIFPNTQEELENIGQFFEVATHFCLCHPESEMNDTSFCALVRLLLTKLTCYFNVYIHTNIFFGHVNGIKNS